MQERDRRTYTGEPSSHLDGEREGIYQDSTGVQAGVSMDGDPKKEVNKNPKDATIKSDPEMLKLNRVMKGRDQSAGDS
ncbi:hypothetical protein SAMN05421676_102417 [Salinibacillus kushneri]|uniref:Uncharacterized protein n=1 Tax=Salinibacillus kushneri TaxID=237682 RepID=A0A1I0BBV9_9BACI|nr:hypothetical protein [Salinibacillus kushneri]SET04405.1 hypothetical protein SAMN05421676_102417 [Salinibacillus kushneri]